MRIRILVFWGYHWNLNGCIYVQAQVDSNSVKVQMTSAVVTLPAMTSAAMNPILLVRCAEMNQLFLGRYAAMNSILLERRDQVDSKIMIQEAITPASMTSAAMNQILLGRSACLGYHIHNDQSE